MATNKKRAMLLPPEGEILIARNGTQYKVTYINVGKMSVSARFVDVVPSVKDKLSGADKKIVEEIEAERREAHPQSHEKRRAAQNVTLDVQSSRSQSKDGFRR